MAEITVPLGKALDRSRCKLGSASGLPALRETYSLAEEERKRLLSCLYVSRPMPGVTGTLDLLAGSSGGSIYFSSFGTSQQLGLNVRLYNQSNRKIVSMTGDDYATAFMLIRGSTAMFGYFSNGKSDPFRPT